MEVAREERAHGLHERRQPVQQVPHDCAPGGHFGQGRAPHGAVAAGLRRQDVQGEDEFGRAARGQEAEGGSLAEDVVLSASLRPNICLFVTIDPIDIIHFN